MLKSYIKAVLQMFVVVIITWALLAVMFFIQTAEPQQAAAEPIASIEVIERIPEPPQPEPQLEYIGEFTITGYCSCAKCCGEANKPTKSGVMPKAAQTVGADLTLLPIGTHLYIEGIGYRVVEDKPADWIIDKYEGKIIDVFCDTHSEAKKVGRQVVKIYKVL